jgi:putative cardiolipin synthase
VDNCDEQNGPLDRAGDTKDGARGDLRKRNVKVTILTNSFVANDVPLAHTGYARYRVELLRQGVDLYGLSPTRIQHNERCFPAHRLAVCTPRRR